jgi:hypothetical protein
MATTTVAETPTFTVGGVASATFGSIGRNFLTFAVLALLAAAPQQAMAFYTTQYRLVGPQLFAARPGVLATYFAALIASVLVSVVVTYVLQAAIVYGTVTDLSGRRASLGSSLSVAFKVLLPLIGLSIVSTLGVMLGLILLIVPGGILALGWSIAVPVRVVERVGVFQSLSRSWELTSGYKGTIFLLALVFGLASWIFGVVGLSFAGVFSFARPTTPVAFPIAFYVYSGVIQAIQALVGGAGVATIYYQLRAMKEGIAPEQLAAVFD